MDSDRGRTGRFVLTGSHQPRLKEAVSQSLAGRSAELELLPLSMEEIASRRQGLSTDEIILRGTLPGVWTSGIDPVDFHRNYLRTYVERDVRTLLEVRHAAAFEKFLHLLAGRVGQLVNLSGLADELGVSVPTVDHWISTAEASFVVFKLRPWSANVGKRFVKSPKIYFTDVGLAALSGTLFGRPFSTTANHGLTEAAFIASTSESCRRPRFPVLTPLVRNCAFHENGRLSDSRAK